MMPNGEVTCDSAGLENCVAYTNGEKAKERLAVQTTTNTTHTIRRKLPSVGGKACKAYYSGVDKWLPSLRELIF
jgi:hypothetical protein